MNPIKVGVIGCGEIALERHLPAWKRNKKAKLFAVCDIDKDKVRKIAKKFNIPNYYTNYREMLDKENELEIIDVCTPTKFHSEHVVNACKKGKHVIVEKPMAATVRECERMIKSAVNNKVKLTICHTLRYYPIVKQAKEWIERGDIGNIKMINIDMPYYQLQPWVLSQGGGLWEIGIHCIYLMLYLLENPKKVEARTYSKKDPQESMEIIFHTKKGIGIIRLLKTRGEQEIKIFGDKGSIIFLPLAFNTAVKQRCDYNSWMGNYKTRFFLTLKELKFIVKRGFEYMIKGVRITPHNIIFNQFIDAVNGKAEVPVPAEEGKKTIEILKEIESKMKLK